MQRTGSLSLKDRVLQIGAEKYMVVAQIDEGSYSDVYQAQRLPDQQVFALKKLRVLQGNRDAQTHLENEYYAASKLGKHPHIV